MEELEEVAARPSFAKYATAEARSDFVSYVRRNGEIFQVSATDAAAVGPCCRDVNDNHILALAQVAEVAVIVSSDRDLLVLSPWNGIPVLTPAEFLAEASKLRGDDPS
jgi:predicted nucleic acid-binding protein